MKKIVYGILSLALLFGTASFTLAEGGRVGHDDASSTQDHHEGDRHLASSTATSTRKLSNEIARADKMIDDRISDLTHLQARINDMKKIATSSKVSLVAKVQASINDLNTLKAKIDADTDATVLKNDIASITSSFRIYKLVMPQIEIVLAADRINVVVDMMNGIGAKFQTRISGVATGSTSSLSATLSDYYAKLADAKLKAAAAASSTLALTPDNGDKTKQDANQQALKNARDMIKTAKEDLKAAREDAETIRKALKELEKDSHKHASSTATSNHHNASSTATSTHH